MKRHLQRISDTTVEVFIRLRFRRVFSDSCSLRDASIECSLGLICDGYDDGLSGR